MPSFSRHYLTTVALSPLLLAQAVYVRKVTPRLPEAEGARQGTAGDGQPLNMLIVGDSAAAGVGVAQQSEALSGRLVHALSSDFQVNWTLLAKTGHALIDVIEHSRTLTDASFDVAVVSAGVNDATGGRTLSHWKDDIGALYEHLHTALGCQLVVFTSVPPMQAFPALPRPLRQFLGHKASRLNDVLRETVEPLDHAALVHPDFPLTPEFIASDGFHPSARAYQVWAETLAPLIRSKYA